LRRSRTPSRPDSSKQASLAGVSAFDASTRRASVSPEPGAGFSYKHDPLYDHLTADNQLTPQEVQAGYVAEWNGLHKVKVAQTRRRPPRRSMTDA
jgi:hypothetical protein